MKTTATILTALALAGSAFAGERVVASKTYVAPATECFRAGEWQLDLFGQWTDGNSPHTGPLRNQGWGGGAGVNYFFTRNLGFGVDGSWLSIQDPDRSAVPLGIAAPVANTQVGGVPGGAAAAPLAVTRNNRRTVLHHYTASLIYRFPIDEICLAPYIYGGGGVAVDGQQWASAHVGLGVEKRLSSTIGLFTDGRFTYYGDRNGRGDHNNISVRVGVRVVF